MSANGSSSIGLGVLRGFGGVGADGSGRFGGGGRLEPSALAVASWTTLPSWVIVAPFVISSSKSRFIDRSGVRCLIRVWMFFAYIWVALPASWPAGS